MAEPRRRVAFALTVALVLVAAGCETGTGSTTSRLGTDPEQQAPVALSAATVGAPSGAPYWLNIDGPTSEKSQGDRFTSQVATNPEYDPSGAWFRIRVSDVVPGQPLVIGAFDPAFVSVGDLCGGADRGYPLFSAAQEAALASAYGGDPLASARYASGPTPYCTGDAYGAMTTTYLVRAPDATPGDVEDNPVVCAISFSPRTGSLYPQLVRADGAAATTPIGALDRLPLSAVFRQHVDLCTVPAGSVVAGTYLVQVRTNAAQPGLVPPTVVADPGIDPLARQSVTRTDPAVTSNGHNRLALRAGWGADPAAPGWADGVWTSTSGRLALYANSATLNQPYVVPLFRVPTFGAGQTLRVELWDVGDGADATLSITPPEDSTLSEPSCSWARDTTPLVSNYSIVVDGCTVRGLSSSWFNGRLLVAEIPIPDDYACDDGTISGCFFTASLTFTRGTPIDTTTWSSSLVP